MNPVGTLETAKAVNPLIQLLTFGQSIWIDYIRSAICWAASCSA